MDDKKTVKMDSDNAENEPTVFGGRQASPGPAPFQRTAMPGADQPTPVPGQGGWGPAPQPQAPWSAPQPGAPPAEGATMLISQRPTPVFAWLVVMDGPNKGHIHQLRPGSTSLGRHQGNDVVIADDACSGQHLKIKIEATEEGEEQFVLFDLASRNGTYVGDKSSYQDASNRTYRHILQDGDYLLLGETTLVFKRV